ncbi:MAG: hypothetical protein KJ574_03275 [Nanoarchaeota archaeon]|nr:hypothetical protein [Nanoarchaeota archaeon]
MKKSEEDSKKLRDLAISYYQNISRENMDYRWRDHQIELAAAKFKELGAIDDLVEERQEVAGLLAEMARKGISPNRNYGIAAKLYRNMGDEERAREVLIEGAEFHRQRGKDGFDYLYAVLMYKEAGIKEERKDCMLEWAKYEMEHQDHERAIALYYALGMKDKVDEVWKMMSEAYLSGREIKRYCKMLD